MSRLSVELIAWLAFGVGIVVIISSRLIQQLRKTNTP
jgi:hypothetical protein